MNSNSVAKCPHLISVCDLSVLSVMQAISRSTKPEKPELLSRDVFSMAQVQFKALACASVAELS